MFMIYVAAFAIEIITHSLKKVISDLAANPSLFLRNPDVDFSRNRKIDFNVNTPLTAPFITLIF